MQIAVNAGRTHDRPATHHRFAWTGPGLQGTHPGGQPRLAGRSWPISRPSCPAIARRRSHGPQADLLPLRQPRAAGPESAGPRSTTSHRRRGSSGSSPRSTGSFKRRDAGPASFSIACRTWPRLVQRPDARQLLHAHMPLRLSTWSRWLIFRSAQLPLASMPPPDRRNDADLARRISPPGGAYIHPTKVQHRYSPTMHMLHVWDGDDSCR